MPEIQEEPDRVRRHTRPEMLRKVDAKIRDRILFYSTQSEEEISRRIEQLEREWDMERCLETNASAFALSGVILGFTVNKKWLLLSAGVLAFLMQHAVQGWCPPIGLFRRLGCRTQNEIDQEKFALKYLRGDFDELPRHPLRAQATQLAEAVQ